MASKPFHEQCQHYSMDELQQQIRESIASQGFAIRHVLSNGIHPPFTYTVGLYDSTTQFPELVISGLSMITRNGFMLELGYAIKGPPSPLVQRRMARNLGVEVKDLGFPPGGVRLEPGKIYRQFTDNGLPMCFGWVEQRHYEDLFGQGIVFHGHANFPVLQVVWSGQCGDFPWMPSYERESRFNQQLLFNHRRDLPLIETRWP